MKKTKVYIDMTILVSVNYMTGIQRVSASVVQRLLHREDLDVVLLCYRPREKQYHILDNAKFLECFEKEEVGRRACITEFRVEPERLETGAVFFDIDNVWNSTLIRSWLYPILKKNGLKIATMVYDIIPISHPQYAHKNTVLRFISYLGAVLENADLIITNSEVTKQELLNLGKKMDVSVPEIKIAWLGCDFKHEEEELPEITYHTDPETGLEVPDKEFLKYFPRPDNIQDVIDAGPYILMVGTLEPRKNHKLLLEALDNGLKLNVVFAGRKGWNVEDLIEKIENHPLHDKKLFWINNANDLAINMLYKNAYCLAFPTFNEGFGLPMIESFLHGTPVVASDIPVLREVGGEFADYIDNTDVKSVVEFFNDQLAHPEKMQQKRENLKNFVPFTWDQTAEAVHDALVEKFDTEGKVGEVHIKQMLVLTARHEDIMKSLPYVEAFMPWIEELIVCCPDNNVSLFTDNYQGKLKLTFFTDSQLLAGRPLPQDHVERNFFLRCQALQQPGLDDVFIMTDDDYRPLMPIEQDVFVSKGRYIGYYSYDLNEWQGTYGGYSSFDIGAFNSRDFLNRQGYPTMQYASHQPQVIDKNIFREMLVRHKEDMDGGAFLSWDVYFNYGVYNHPDKFSTRPYISLGWPGRLSSWNLYCNPEPLLFENFYEDMYEDGGMFKGLSKFYTEDAVAENREKIRIFKENVLRQFKEREVFDSYCEFYQSQFGAYPGIVIYVENGQLAIHLPSYMQFACDCWTRVPVTITPDVYQLFPGKVLRLGYGFCNSLQIPVLNGKTQEIFDGDTKFMMPVRSPKQKLKGGLMNVVARITDPYPEDFDDLPNEEKKEILLREPLARAGRKIPAIIA